MIPAQVTCHADSAWADGVLEYAKLFSSCTDFILEFLVTVLLLYLAVINMLPRVTLEKLHSMYLSFPVQLHLPFFQAYNTNMNRTLKGININKKN